MKFEIKDINILVDKINANLNTVMKPFNVALFQRFDPKIEEWLINKERTCER